MILYLKYRIVEENSWLLFRMRALYNRYRSSCPAVFCKKGILKNFAKFRAKYLCQSLPFIIKLQAWGCIKNFIKNNALAQVFSNEVCEIFKDTFYTEHLRVTASESFWYPGCKYEEIDFIRSNLRLGFSWFLDLRGNLRIVKEKAIRKTCFSRGKKCLALRIYQAKFCLAVFLWSQRNFYYIFTRNRC